MTRPEPERRRTWWRCRGWAPGGREVEAMGRTPIEASQAVDREIARLLAGEAK
jgi:hypothetical protein